MRAIVLGGSGFVGSHVADALTDAGHEATVFDCQPSLWLRPSQRFIEGDILDAEALAAAVSGHDVVYNFAGMADLDQASTHPADTVSLNVLGCVNALEASRRAGVERFVYASTIYVYSDAGGFYRASKQSAELYVEEYARRYDLGYTILRYGTLYGRRADERNSVHRFLRQALLERQIMLPGTGDEVREYIHVGDAARASVDVLAAAFRNEHVMLTGHHPMKVGDLVGMIREIVGPDVAVDTAPPSGDRLVAGHYALTPYSFRPKVVRKLVSHYLICLMSGIRLSRRVVRELGVRRVGARRILILGAGDAGEMIVREMTQNKGYDAEPVGFIDDDERKVGQRIHGVPVLGTRANLVEIVERRRPSEVLVAVPSATPAFVRDVVRALEPYRVRITTLPSMNQLVNGRVQVSQIRPLAIEDLLSRAPVGLSSAALQNLVAGKRVLVTGAGGSIGSELCRQIADLRAGELIALDRYENSLFDALNTIGDLHPGLRLKGVIADVTDRRRIDDVFALHRPHVVFHAAAHKHVPLMEENPCEAVKNNVAGSRIVAQAAEHYGADRLILISTDKAVHPTSVMGATKRVAELMMHELGEQGRTNFSTVRFGNVLGSNGSVIPRFIEQIRKGGPVTVTHPEMRRYFMLITEAVQLVLHAAALEGRGHTYILDMGEPVRLLDLARDLIRLSGYIPDAEIAITFVGSRPGEKLSEELVGGDEAAEPSPVDKIQRLRSTMKHPLNGRLLAAIAQLEDAAAAGQTDLVYQQLSALVPTFSPSPQLADA